MKTLEWTMFITFLLKNTHDFVMLGIKVQQKVEVLDYSKHSPEEFHNEID